MSNDLGKNHGKTLLKAKWLNLEKNTFAYTYNQHLIKVRWASSHQFYIILLLRLNSQALDVNLRP